MYHLVYGVFVASKAFKKGEWGNPHFSISKGTKQLDMLFPVKRVSTHIQVVTITLQVNYIHVQ